MTHLFDRYRIVSVTRPNLGVGMIEGYATGYPRHFTRQQLEAIDAEAIGFYVDDFLMLSRGEERHQEKFVLQGGLNRTDWVDIKPITPLPGEGPEPDFGDCAVCERPLEEAEFAIGDTCDPCLQQAHDREQELTRF